MLTKKSDKKKHNKKIENDSQIIDIISQTKYINIVINKNFELDNEQFKINDNDICLLEKYFSLYKKKYFYKYYFKIKYISDIKSLFKLGNNKFKHKNYVTSFVYLILYLLEANNSIIYNRKKILLNKIINILQKLYLMKRFNDSDILLIIKFVIYSSIYERKEIYDNNFEILNDLNNKNINNYEIFKYSFEIIKKINNFETTLQFCIFLKNKILMNKINLSMISSKPDLLHLLYLSEEQATIKGKILSFVSEVYALKYNKFFLDIFFQKINEKYKDYNATSQVDLLNDINKSLFILKELQKREDDILDNDSFILNQGFICNNHRFNGITVENVILQSEFTIIFSFNFSPELFEINNKNNVINSQAYKIKQINILQTDSSIYPILYLTLDNNRINNDGLNFYIQHGFLHHKILNMKKIIKVCPIKENKTYICCYTIKENHEYIIYVKSQDEDKLIREDYKAMIKNNLTLKLGKFFRRNFEGYIGPLLLFKKYYELAFLKNIFCLEGSYEKMLFIHNFSTDFIKKYDRIENYLRISKSQKRNKYISAIKNIRENNNINEELEIYISPVYEGSRLDKKVYIDCTFKETKVLYYNKPTIENGATFFFRYKYTPFEFVKYEGINYLILIIELILTSVDNIKNKFHEQIILDLFVNVLNYSNKILNLLCQDFYINEIRRLLFSLEKCIIRICKYFKMTQKMNKALSDFVKNLSSKIPDLAEEKLINNINIRNEILKLLIDINLFNLNDYSSLTFFLKSFNDSFDINSTGLLNMEFFKKVVSFSKVFEQIINPKNSEIKKNAEYKKFKMQFRECLDTFFIKTEVSLPFIYIFNIFSCDIRFNYLKYQFLKIFYLYSPYFFQNIEDNKLYLSTWKYFVELYEYIQSKEKFIEISKKEGQIIMAICLRIIIENPIVEDFYKYNKKFTKSVSINSSSKKTNYLFNSSIWKMNDSEEEFEKKELNSTDNNLIQRKRTFSFSKNANNHLILDKSKENNIYKRKNSEDKAINYNVKKYGFKVDNKRKNYILNKRNMNKTLSFEVINNSFFSNQKCIDYFYFETFFKKLCSSMNFNDYCFRSLLLLILEKNNEVNIPQKVKFKFITKINKYDDLLDKDFNNFLKIKYFNKETKSQFTSLLNLIEKNVNQLTFITYDIILFLIIRTSQERKNNKCVFRHLISSKKICGKLFFLAFSHNKQALVSIFGKFSTIINSIIPYHKTPFFFDFIYDIMTNEKLRDYGQVLINLMVVMSFENEIDSKFYYHFHVQTLILLYRIMKSKAIKNKNFNFEEQVISNIFNENLILTKYNMLYNVSWAKGKNKCYVELLYEVLVSLCVWTKNEKYFLLLYKMFVKYVTKFTSYEGHSILFFIDQINPPCNKSNPVQKYFSKFDTSDVPSLTIQILLKTLKYYTKYKNTEAKNILVSLSSAFTLDANDIFLGKDSKRKKEYKNKLMYNKLRSIISNSCKKPKGKDKSKKISFISHDSLLLEFEKIYKEYISHKKAPNNTLIIRSISLALPFPEFNIKMKNEEHLSDDSFSSCKSDKNSKSECINNHKKKFRTTTNRDNFKNFNIYENIEKNDELFNIDENDYYINLSNASLLKPKEKSNRPSSINLFSKDKKDIKITEKKDHFSFDKINTFDYVCLFPKQNLVEQIFAIYFVKKLFYSEPFVRMKNYYKYIIKKETGKIINMKNYFNYPTIMKNYIPRNFYFGGLFLKHDLNFFSNDYFNISHSYFIDKVKNIKINRIFKQKSNQNDINRFILNKNDPNNNMFYVDLVTNRKVIFGELIISKYLIYFHSQDKNLFLKGKTDKEKAKWILGSPEYDYSSKKKKIYIFKDEILEIINRRFLYSFQACEFYLKNGKSYYFNFYSEEKKIKFFSLFKNKKISIISDLKSDFKKQNFTKLWLNDNISTLEYLLFINKYSCRSYNDVNQYPVFPWLKISGDKERDLRYTIAAQTEEDRMVLKEMYSVNNFPHHYSTHYSNASFLIYYLIRVNPFTDNQITLQVKKFDIPERQFCSIEEIQRILFRTRQPREVIPEFFINTNFFYNYNCNYFGKKSDGEIVDNLNFSKKYENPLDYILSNATMLESNKVKSTINNFFDDIFGVGQMGGCEKYNTYDKYCYQEMIDLKQKIDSFQSKGLSLNEIKEKIGRKSNKIISFGQTPFKLFEDKHPEWSKEKIIEKKNKNIDSFIKFNYRIIHFGFSKGIVSNNSINYCFVLIRKNINNFELSFYDLGLKEDKDKISTIYIPKKIKLFSKLYIFQSKYLYSYKNNPKFIMINYELIIFIFVHLTDNSFTIFNQKGNKKSYLTGSLITCIIKGPSKIFLTGHIDGKINEWQIYYKREEGSNIVNLEEIQIENKREYIAHKNSVNGIYYSFLLDLIISSGDDKIFIRKYYDLSLLSIISIEYNICIELKLSLCYLYILLFDSKRKKYIVKVYSMNGILVAQSDYDLINNIDIDSEGNILVGYYKKYKIDIFNASIQRKIKEINIEMDSLIDGNNNKNKDNIPIFQSFYYHNENNSIYCSFSNGYLIKRYIGKEKEI